MSKEEMTRTSGSFAVRDEKTGLRILSINNNVGYRAVRLSSPWVVLYWVIPTDGLVGITELLALRFGRFRARPKWSP
jgi:hypothetical protein